MFPIPERGIWTAVGLTRGQFFGILFVVLLMFLLWNGPVWSHMNEAHTWRIVGSYLAVPLLVAVGLWRNRTFRIRSWLEASFLLALIKLLVTVVMFLSLALLI